MANNNQINDLAYIPQQPNLTTLHLEHNQINKIKQIKLLKNCENLTELSFGHVNQNSIRSISNQQNTNQICYDSLYPLFVIKELSQLQLLDYDDNQGDYGPEYIYKYISETQRQISKKQYYDDIEYKESIVE
ncbi:Leucine-rich_repeat domain superfamily [Hexamita inflata]|uniref:Leucine-rich repeat domain superfamily n=1 Tax=Hexamita inflata TaxID=28002 RepID=A0AA86TI75_9EUKA|nr:Leucine-rich repeat domain superfamily [Hexamita inflata]